MGEEINADLAANRLPCRFCRARPAPATPAGPLLSPGLARLTLPQATAGRVTISSAPPSAGSRPEAKPGPGTRAVAGLKRWATYAGLGGSNDCAQFSARDVPIYAKVGGTWRVPPSAHGVCGVQGGKLSCDDLFVSPAGSPKAGWHGPRSALPRRWAMAQAQPSH